MAGFQKVRAAWLGGIIKGRRMGWAFLISLPYIIDLFKDP